MMKDQDTFVIKDLEQIEVDKANAKKRRREALEDSDSDGLETVKQKIKDSRSRGKSPGDNKFKQSNPQVPLKKRDAKKGQAVKHSADAYKSKMGGKGDVLKPGTHEPYAYIKLNPDMLNPKKKQQAVQSFSGVVSHGKKLDKRTFKRKEGMLAGMSVSKNSDK